MVNPNIGPDTETRAAQPPLDQIEATLVAIENGTDTSITHPILREILQRLLAIIRGKNQTNVTPEDIQAVEQILNEINNAQQEETILERSGVVLEQRFDPNRPTQVILDFQRPRAASYANNSLRNLRAFLTERQQAEQAPEPPEPPEINNPEVPVPRGAHIAVEFFESYSHVHHIRGLDHGGWKEAEAEDMFRAVFNLINHEFIIMQRGKSPFIKDLNFYHIKLESIEESPTLGALFTSIGALGHYFEEKAARGGVEEAVHAKYERNSTRIQEIINNITAEVAELGRIFRGGESHNEAKDNSDRVLEAHKQHAPDSRMLTKFFTMGTGYPYVERDASGVERQVTAGQIAMRCTHLYLAINDPTYHRYAVASSQLEPGEDHDTIIMGVYEKNPHSIYPAEVENPVPGEANIRQTKRLLLRIIAGEIKENPAFRRYIDNKGLTDFYNQSGVLHPWMLAEPSLRQEKALNYYLWRMYGDPENYPAPENFAQQVNPKRPHQNSFWERMKSVDFLVNRAGEVLSDEEKDANARASMVEAATYNLMEETEVAAFANAAKLLKDPDGNYRTVTLQTMSDEGVLEDTIVPIVDTKTGPDGIKWSERAIHALAYSAKLTGTSGFEGTPGDPDALPYVFKAGGTLWKLMMDERKGILQDKIFSMTDQDCLNLGLEFERYLSEYNPDSVNKFSDAWTYLVKLFKWYKFGIDDVNFNELRTTKLNAITSETNDKALKALHEVFRAIHYVISRDLGKPSIQWTQYDGEVENDNKLISEMNRVKIQLGQIRPLLTPQQLETALLDSANYSEYQTRAGVSNDVLTNHLRKLLPAINSISPHHEIYYTAPFQTAKGEERHFASEGRPEGPTGQVVWQSSAHEYFRIAFEMPENTHFNEFEKLVRASSTEPNFDPYLASKKLIGGNLLIIALRKSRGVSTEDVLELMGFLCREYWDSLHNNAGIQLARNIPILRNFVSRQQTYAGEGYFTKKEAEAIIKEGLGSSWYSQYMTYLLEQMARFRDGR